MEYLIGVGSTLVHAFVSPVNCVGHLGSDLLNSFGNFAQCFGANLAGGAVQVGEVVTNASSTISSIGA